jgi:hypothetical protein
MEDSVKVMKKHRKPRIRGSMKSAFKGGQETEWDKEGNKIMSVGIIWERVFDIEKLDYSDKIEGFEQIVDVRDPYHLKLSEATENLYFVRRAVHATGRTKDLDFGPMFYIGTVKNVDPENGEKHVITMTGREIIVPEGSGYVLNPTSFKAENIVPHSLNPKYNPEAAKDANIKAIEK